MKKIFVIALSAAVLAACCSTQPEKKEIGVQLYSLRSLIGNPELYAQNHEEVLKALADMGYTSAEAACYKDGKLYGVEPEQYKADLEAAGLVSLSTHVGRNLSPEEWASGEFSEATIEWWKQCIDAHTRAGVKYVVMPSVNRSETLEQLDVVCKYLDFVGKMCAEAGLQFGYHNHYQEYRQIEDTTVLDYVIEHTDPELVFFQMDVYWTVIGKAAPVEYIEKYPGRFRMFHVKDHYEIGASGMVGFDAIFGAAETAGLQDYIVEVEGYGDLTWEECMSLSAEYLQNASFVKASYSAE